MRHFFVLLCAIAVLAPFGLASSEASSAQLAATHRRRGADAVVNRARRHLEAGTLHGTYWAAYKANRQPVSTIPWEAFSFVNYFTTVSSNGSDPILLPPDQPVSDLRAFVRDARKHGVAPIVVTGGWTGSLALSSLMATEESRRQYAQHIKNFVNKYNFAGIDIDWEFPGDKAGGIGCNAASPKDSENYLAFLKELRRVLGRNKLITAAVSIKTFVDSKGQPMDNMSAFAKYFDWVSVMTYDIGGSWSETTGPTGPLHTSLSESSIQSAIEGWVKAKFPKRQLLVGIPSYANSFQTKSSILREKRAPNGQKTLAYQEWTKVVVKGDKYDLPQTGSDVCGKPNPKYTGTWTLNTLISGGLLSKDGKRGAGAWKRFFDESTGVPFIFNSAKKMYITYDDAQSVRGKARWTKANKLGGIFTFDVEGFPTDVHKEIRRALRP